MGKAYANKKPLSERPESDFYPTPEYLIHKLISLEDFDTHKQVLEPACGDSAITNVLKQYGMSVIEHDIRKDKVDFLTYDKAAMGENFNMIVTNPPFSLFDDFVTKAISICDDVWLIGKVNFFGGHDRNIKGMWKHLESISIFDRMADYRIHHDNGQFSCGMLVTGWFHFTGETHDFTKLKVIDVQSGVYQKKSSTN